MDKGDDCQQVFGIFLCHCPINSRFVGSGIPKHSEGPTHQIGKATLFTQFACAGVRIDCQKRWTAAEHSINERCPVILQSGPAAHFVGDAFHCFLDGMEIVVGKKFGPAEFQGRPDGPSACWLFKYRSSAGMLSSLPKSR